MRQRPLALVCAVLLLGAPRSGHAQSPPEEPPTEMPGGVPVTPTLPRASSPGEQLPTPRIRYALEGIEIRGNTRTAPRVVLRYVKFRAGDVLDVEDPEIELTRYRLLGTGFFKSVELSLRKGSHRGSAVLVIEVVERNTLVVQNLWLGIAADEDTAGHSQPRSAYVGVQVAETNLAGTGITLGAGIGLAENQLALRTQFIDPAFLATNWSVAAGLLYSDARDYFGNRGVAFESPLLDDTIVPDYAVVAYKRFGGTVGVGHDLSVAARFSLDYHLEQIDAVVPTVASHLRGDAREPIRFDIRNGKSILSELHGVVQYDSRDMPFLPKHGTLASAALTTGLPPLGSAYGFAKIEVAAKRWWLLPWRHVVSLELFGGAIGGDAPFFEKFYVGDFTDLLPDRLLELAPDRRRPPNLLGTDIVEVRYGDYAGKLQAEYRVPIYTGRGSIYGIDVFAATGLWGVAGREDLTNPPKGYTGLARLPVDLTYNLGLRIDTNIGGVTLAFSNLLGFVPARHGARQ